jgi:competence protein ComEC
MSKKRKKNNYSKIITIILILLAFLYGSFFDEINTSFGLIYDGATDSIIDTISTQKNDSQNEVIDGNLKIYYLDVGQADSILIDSSGEYMMIDGGNNNDGPLIVKYLQSLGISKFKYIVGTHPHEDHIGGLDDIIDNFDVENIYIPDAIATTKNFEDLLDSIDKKNMTYQVPKINDTFYLGKATIKVIYTGTDTRDLNNTSIVLKLTYDNTSYLFTGDATDSAETKMLNQDIKADVLKIGHHGSKYSSTDTFLKKVDPKYAVISVGKDNKYGHPASSTITKLSNMNIETHRTDEEGTILINSDGKNISFSNIETNTDGG